MYGKPFKMMGKSPMMKKLVGKQGNLPAELKAKIEASPVKKSYKQAYADSASARKKYKTLADFTTAAKGYNKKKQTEHVAEGNKKNVSLDTKKVSTPKLKTQTPSLSPAPVAPKTLKKRVQKKVDRKVNKIEKLETKKETRTLKGKSTKRVDKKISRKKNKLKDFTAKIFKRKNK
tara:strand:- start:36 stop:560 length:525 start_codon:yes stop_codon:yes gene_type:complete